MSQSLSAATTAPRAPESHASLPRILSTVAELRGALRTARLAGLTIGLVPTMGALHRGHLSLIAAARLRCDLVVVSVFVNPTQFEEQSDLLAYPRDETRDAVLAGQAGADILFAPPPREIYRPGFSTTVEVHGLTDRLEGTTRGKGHFRGVTTVVCKLLHIVAPDVAYFGQKDAQQAAVITRMVADLDIETEIETMPIVREPDGLAMSSRNVRLSPAERERALALHAALSAAQRLADDGERSGAHLIEEAQRTLAAFSVTPEYVALVDRESFEGLDRLDPAGLMLLAARIGQTRLIDNLLLQAPRAQANRPADAPAQHQQLDPPNREDREGAVIAACSA
jgi:pantoate--beta-alanine ligase